MDVEPIPEEKVHFRFKKAKMKKPEFRKVHQSTEEDQDDDVSEMLEELKEIQKMREKSRGISAAVLAVGKQVVEDDQIMNDPFQVKNGGMVDMKAVKKTGGQSPDDAYDTEIGTTFSVETNARDEDDDMRRYIDEQLAKRKGCVKEDDQEERKYMLPEEAALFAVPEHLRKSSSKKSEEMLSNQMLSATEEAKLRLLHERMKQKDIPSEFVPSNMAVNFMHHNRFNLDNRGGMKSSWAGPGDHSRGAKRSANEEKATDDFHYEKFKKQFRRQ